MSYAASMETLNGFRHQISELRQKMRDVQAEVEPELVDDYEFATVDGPVTLSELFGSQSSLIVIHNMGQSCVYCTMWADGFNGVYQHLANRAAFVLTSPDAPEKQRQFADSRGWAFPIVSHQDTSFAADMGYTSEKYGFAPGISVFKKDGDQITRVSDAHLGPGDDFCNVWHFLDLLPEGPDGWEPKYRYGS